MTSLEDYAGGGNPFTSTRALGPGILTPGYAGLFDGYVFDARFHDLEWQSPESFGERLGLRDVDEDGIPEVIGEFQGRFLRIFDIDLRREKSSRR